MTVAIWREKNGRGEGESDQTVTKTKKWRYLRARGNMAEPRDTSASRSEAWEGWIASCGECLDASRGKGRRRGAARGFKGRARLR